MRFNALNKRLSKLEPPPPWIDNDVDNFRAAAGALPGEGIYDVLERRALEFWREEDPPENPCIPVSESYLS